jgi:hypothetical protein
MVPAYQAGAQAVRKTHLCTKGDCRDGEGTSVRRDREGRVATYTGSFKNGKPHGAGNLVFEVSDGRAELHGHFEEGLLQGAGWATFSTGRYLKRFDGNFRDNAPFTEIGTLQVFKPQGDLLYTIEGRIVGFDCQGRCTMRWADGRTQDICMLHGSPRELELCPHEPVVETQVPES